MGNQRIVSARLVLTPLRVADAEEMAGVLADPALYTVIGGEPPDVETLRARYERQVVGHSPDGEEQWLNWVVRLRSETGPDAADPDAAGPAIGFAQATVTAELKSPGFNSAVPSRVADVAWVIGTAWQGHGYASEAARAMVDWLRAQGVSTLMAHVHPDHVASQRVAQRAGLNPTQQFHDGEQRWSSGPSD